MVIRVAVVGASGRMGALIVNLIEELDGFELAASITSQSDLEIIRGADLCIDVSRIEVSRKVVQLCVEASIPLIVGTSGWTATEVAEVASMHSASNSSAAVLFVPNFSLGSVIGSRLAVLAAKHFPTVEIVETHHAGKVDSPSGTARRTAEQISEVREHENTAFSAQFLTTVASSSGKIVPDQPARGIVIEGVPIHSLRIDGVLAEQSVIFGGTGETLTITHNTSSADSYLAGIRLALTRISDLRGVTVGLDVLLGV